jgi:predicted DNA-binding transcriptional regulator AlpA
LTYNSTQLLPPAEALKRLGGFSRAKLYRLMGTPEFPKPIHIGRSIYFDEAEIGAYIESRRAARDKLARNRGRKAA